MSSGGADGTCNPYLLSACLLAAGLDGIKNKIDPGEPIEDDVSLLDETTLKEKGISLIPRSLDEALQCLEENTILADTVGRDIWTEFIKVKRTEWDKFHQHVTAKEVDVYSKMY